MQRIVVVLLTLSLFSVNGYSYGPRGHHMVGAIADRRLAKNEAVAKSISELLDGLTLEQAATLPDEIKSWDRCGKAAKIKGPGKAVNASKRINKELRAFLKANLCDSEPSHHEFHYTDVPVRGDLKYANAEVGVSDFDIVQMIPFAIRVLRDKEPQPNDRAITKSVAVILLAHYLGDIHQPLHVGAEFFNEAKKPFNPTKNDTRFEDQGGNKLKLFTLMKGEAAAAGKLHGYWDGQTVTNAFGNTSDVANAKKLANKEPDDWQLSGDVETWAQQLADEILPIAREAHTRLQYSNIVIKAGERDIISGDAKERKKSSGQFYAIWAAAVVKDEIHRAGWQLAALLEELLQ